MRTEVSHRLIERKRQRQPTPTYKRRARNRAPFHTAFLASLASRPVAAERAEWVLFGTSFHDWARELKRPWYRRALSAVIRWCGGTAAGAR